jgi:hypothetical protein
VPNLRIRSFIKWQMKKYKQRTPKSRDCLTQASSEKWFTPSGCLMY